MSVKEKHEKSKRASVSHSLRHEEKPTQSISSHSSYIEYLERKWERLIRGQEFALKAYEQFKNMSDELIG